MRYSVPVNAPEEVAALAAAGASELYCGYQDAWWTEHYGNHDSASRRQGLANLSTSDELKATVRAAREHGLPIHLALNSRYTEPQLDHLVELCANFNNWGGTGVILSDLGLLWRLNDIYSRDGDLDITLSLLAVAQNTATLRVFHRLNVSRVVFPRFVSWQEAGSLLSGVPGMKGSVMAFFDKCPLVDGYCRHRHLVSYPDRAQGEGLPAGDAVTGSGAGKTRAMSDADNSLDDGAEPLYTFDTTYRTHACLGKSCTYLEPYPCAACHLLHFEQAGVDTAKIGGRGRPLEERLRALRFLREAEGLESDMERIDLYQKTFGQRCACYYGEATQSRYAIEPLDTPDITDSRWGRVYVGSQTDTNEFQRALMSLCRGDLPKGDKPLTLLVPPLSNGILGAFVTMLPTLISCVPYYTHVAVNDLGTLAALTDALAPHASVFFDPANDTVRVYSPVEPTMGTLLARMDDVGDVLRYQSPTMNPSRPVWDLEGRPRMLMYAVPPFELTKHWLTPSLTEPSAQKALSWLFSWSDIPYEFEV